MNLFSVKLALAALALFWQVRPNTTSTHDAFRYRRSVGILADGPAGQACAVLDAPVFAHAAPSLKDLRLYAGQTEISYAITLSEPLEQESEDARIFNLGAHAGNIAFDLEMPHRPYSLVMLDLVAKDFIATVEVSGSESPNKRPGTDLGRFTLFDLTSQQLSRDTSIPLAESSFAYLHVELALVPAPGDPASAWILNDPAIVQGAAVPPSREAQTVYTTVQESANVIERGRQSVATFQVPHRVPIERVSFVLAPSFKGNFSRPVEITAREARVSAQEPPDIQDSIGQDEAAAPGETVAGRILRVHMVAASHEIARDDLSVSTAVGSNMQRPATVDVAIDNGDGPPIPIAAVQLQMRQRQLCFEAPTSSPLTLYYGDPALEAPLYGYASLFQPKVKPIAAPLGPEVLNATFKSRDGSRSFNKRHPEFLWIALLAGICIASLAAIHATKRSHRGDRGLG